MRGVVAKLVRPLTDEARAEARGHVVTEHVEWIDMDDSSGHVRCSCGWQSRSVKVCWLFDMAGEHRRQVLGKPAACSGADAAMTRTLDRERP